MQCGWSCVVAWVALAQLPAGPSPTEVRVPRCVVSVIEDVQIPAQESGVLEAVEVREGMLVAPGALLAQINDKQSQLQREAAAAELAAARKKATDDINERYATAARDVASKDLELSMRANERVGGSAFSVIEIQKKTLEVKQASLQIEKAMHDREMAGFDAQAADAKVRLSDEQVQRRQILSPLDGEIVEVLYRKGEWVEPGKAVFRVIGMRRLRVTGFVQLNEVSPSEIAQRPVRVLVTMTRGRREEFHGKVAFVDPRVQAGGQYRIWAEVENRLENGLFVLRPGVDAEMLIDTAGVVPVQAAR